MLEFTGCQFFQWTVLICRVFLLFQLLAASSEQMSQISQYPLSKEVLKELKPTALSGDKNDLFDLAVKLDNEKQELIEVWFHKTNPYLAFNPKKSKWKPFDNKLYERFVFSLKFPSLIIFFIQKYRENSTKCLSKKISFPGVKLNLGNSNKNNVLPRD